MKITVLKSRRDTPINLFNNNLCQEIMLTGQQQLRYTLGLTTNYYFSKTHAALNRLPVNKYKFTRANWYVADFNWRDQAEVEEWCWEQFGPHPKNPDAWSRWYNKYSEKIHFRDEKDYVWFCMKWGA